MRGIGRLAVVSAVAVVAFVGALVPLRDLPTRECLADAMPDASF